MHPWNVWNLTELKLWGKWRFWVWLVSEVHSFLHGSSAVKVKVNLSEMRHLSWEPEAGLSLHCDLRATPSTKSQIHICPEYWWICCKTAGFTRVKKTVVAPRLESEWMMEEGWQMRNGANERAKYQYVCMKKDRKHRVIQSTQTRSENRREWRVINQAWSFEWKSLVSAADVWQCLRLQAWPGLTGLDAYTVGLSLSAVLAFP